METCADLTVIRAQVQIESQVLDSSITAFVPHETGCHHKVTEPTMLQPGGKLV